MKEDLSAGNYAAAFQLYAADCDQLITRARDDNPFSEKDLPHESLSPLILPICLIIGLVAALILFTIFSKGREARVRKKIYKSIRIFRGKADVELIICPRSLSNSLCWEKNTNLMRRRYRRQDLPFPQTGNTAERNSSESREWAEKIEAFGENQFPKNCRDVFAELNDLTAEVRNKFTEEENG